MTDYPRLVLNNINVVYKNLCHAIKNIDLDIHGGKITALIGTNGGGKSTLFNTIMGFIKPDTGIVSFNGKTIKKALKSNNIAYVPQAEEIDYNFPILVKEVVMTGRYGHMGFMRIASAEDKLIVEEALDKVGLSDLANRQIGELSGGQKKRVFLARSLVQEAEMLLLDEPFTGVDSVSEQVIIEQLKSLSKQNKLILISTHNLKHIPSFCDDVILIKQQIIAYGKVSEQLTQENLEKTFGEFSFFSAKV